MRRRPAHRHRRITAPGCRQLIIRVFRDGDHWLDSGAVFGVRSSRMADWVRHEPVVAPEGIASTVPFDTIDHDFILERA